MAIPDYQSLMLPLVRFHADEREHSLREAIDELAEELRLTDAERRELLPSGQQAVFDNRVGWARTYLKKAAVLEATRRGYSKITSRGLDILKQNPSRIDVKYLKQFPEFIVFQSLHSDKDAEEDGQDSHFNGTPEEVLESAYQKVRNDLAISLLERVRACSPAFFERLVVELIVKMGYGGSRLDAGKAIGRSGDGGLDGIIKEDKLGLDIIYIQAKRWQSVVGRPEIQKFVGALQGQGAHKGLFISTADFSKEAMDYASRVPNKIVLIGGEELAELMIDHGVGVSTVASFELKRIDSDYFAED